MRKSFFRASATALVISLGFTSCDDLDDLGGITLTPSIPIEETIVFDDPSQGDSIILHQGSYHVIDLTSDDMPGDIKTNLNNIATFKINQIQLKFDERTFATAARYSLRGEIVLFEVPEDSSLIPSNESSVDPVQFPAELNAITTIPLQSNDWLISTEWSDKDQEGTFVLPIDPQFEENISNYLLAEKKIGAAMLYQFNGSGALQFRATAIFDLELRL